MITRDPESDDSAETQLFHQEITRILGLVNQNEDSTLRERWDSAYSLCRSRKLKGLTGFFHKVVVQPPIVATPATTSPVAELTKLFQGLGGADPVPAVSILDLDFEYPDPATVTKREDMTEELLEKLNSSVNSLHDRITNLDQNVQEHSARLNKVYDEISEVEGRVEARLSANVAEITKSTTTKVHAQLQADFANMPMATPLQPRQSAPYIPEENVAQYSRKLPDRSAFATTSSSSDTTSKLFYGGRRDQRITSQGRSKLRSYSKEGENFSVFENRFLALWRSHSWSDDEALSELINNLDGPAQRIVQSRHDSLWTVESLLAACNKRLRAKYSITQVQAELDQLKALNTDTPEKLMCKVEDVIFKCQVTEHNQMNLMILQRNAFVRLLYIHMPMYYYVCEESPNFADPYGALDAAEEYLSTKGHSNKYISDLMKDNLEKWGVKIQEDGKSDTATGGSTTTVPALHSGIAELQTQVAELNAKIKQEKPSEDVHARFNSTKNKPEDWYERITKTTNDHERSIRAMTATLEKLITKLDMSSGKKQSNNNKPQNTDNKRPRNWNKESTSTGSKNGNGNKRQWKNKQDIHINIFKNTAEGESDNADDEAEVTEEVTTPDEPTLPTE